MDVTVKQVKAKTLFLKFGLLFGAVCLGMVALSMISIRPEVGFLLFRTAWYIFLSQLIDLPIFYYCAIKKRGTRWLTVSIWGAIIFGGASVLFDVFTWVMFYLKTSLYEAAFLQALRNEFPKYVINDIYPFFKTNVAISLFFTYLGYEVLKFNLALRRKNNIFQYKIMLQSIENRLFYRELIQAKTKYELEFHYKQLKQKFPWMTKFIRFKYRKRRKALSRQTPIILPT